MEFVIKTDKITTPIFIKLFTTRMVASRRSGIPYNFKARKGFFDFLVSKFLIFEGEREKYATSEPDIRAEDINKTNKTSIQMKIPVEKG